MTGRGVGDHYSLPQGTQNAARGRYAALGGAPVAGEAPDQEQATTGQVVVGVARLGRGWVAVSGLDAQFSSPGVADAQRALRDGICRATCDWVAPERASPKGQPTGIRPRQTGKTPEGLEPPPRPCQRTTSRKTPGQRRGGGFWRLGYRPASQEPAARATRSRNRATDPTEANLSKPAVRSAPYTAPILLVLGAMNAWTAQQTEDYGSLSTALCLCVFTPGYLVRTCCNAAIAVTVCSSRTSQRIPEPRPAT